jgi:hypothetical protein
MASVECLQEKLRGLVLQRQALRERDAGRDELESNRLELLRCHRQLSHVLIDRHFCHPRTAAPPQTQSTTRTSEPAARLTPAATSSPSSRPNRP